MRRKIEAYHRYVQLACVAQGIQQHLAVNHRRAVWQNFGSWMRTMKPALPPSEAVVAQAMRSSLGEFLATGPQDHQLRIFLLNQVDHDRCPAMRLVG